MVPLTRLAGAAALIAAASLAAGQDQTPGTASEAARRAETTASEWSVLASNLEQRVARLLPCDARVRTAIEEVSRASEARFAALTAYWQEAAKTSASQVDAARKLVAASSEWTAEWKTDRGDSEQEQTQVAAESSDLRQSAGPKITFQNAERALNGVSESVAAAAKEAASRESGEARLDASLSDLAAAAQARQAAIENELKALATENTRWSAYYGARAARAQTECAITQAAEPAPAPRRPAKKGQ